VSAEAATDFAAGLDLGSRSTLDAAEGDGRPRGSASGEIDGVEKLVGARDPSRVAEEGGARHDQIACLVTPSRLSALGVEAEFREPIGRHQREAMSQLRRKNICSMPAQLQDLDGMTPRMPLLFP